MICSKSYQLWECYILMRELRITFSGYMENQAVRVRGFNKLNVSVSYQPVNRYFANAQLD
jgi:hypothetical protein